MNAKTYLKQIRKLTFAIENTDTRIRELRAAATNLGATDYGKPVVMASSGNEAAYASKIERIVELEQKMEAERVLLEELKCEILSTLCKIENADEYNLLCKRYVECKRWELIAVEMSYSFDYVRGELHRKALSSMQAVLNENNKKKEKDNTQ